MREGPRLVHWQHSVCRVHLPTPHRPPQIFTPLQALGPGGDLPCCRRVRFGMRAWCRRQAAFATCLPLFPWELSRVCDFGVAPAKANLRIPCADISCPCSLSDDGLLEGLPTPLINEGCLCVCVGVCVCVTSKPAWRACLGITYYSHFTGFSVAQFLAQARCFKKPV